MSYRVLARKYRSGTFDELLGQSAIATTLKNAVASGRIHHGYLFTGTRGVGKTSMARILAKALNCLKYDAPTPTPCGVCESCRNISEGEDIDVIEIDAASNTGVDNIRDLRSNAIFRPARSRFKIYIIDEVHMLSTGAFNALLKTLEEPPGHVKFILATTESHKVPATIQSRCQRFDFRSLDVDTIATHLTDLLEREGVKSDERVVRRVARLARGSMRDSLSILDQLLSFGGNELTPAIADDVLPNLHEETVSRLVDAIAESDASKALMCIEEALNSGHTPDRFCDALIDHLRTLMLLNLCGPETHLVDLPSGHQEKSIEQSRRFDASTFVYMIGLCEELRRAVKSSVAGRALLDAGVVRLSMASQFSDLRAALTSISGGTAAPEPVDPKKKVAAPAPPPPGVQPQPKPSSAVQREARPVQRTSAPSLVPANAVAGAAHGPSRSESSTTAVGSDTRGMGDRQKAMADPIVRRALELFQGQIAGIRPGAGQVAQATDDSAVENSAGSDIDETVAADS